MKWITRQSRSGRVPVAHKTRFLVKFAEIVAAGLATAVSGYLIAHLSGALSSPVPAPARAVVQNTLNANPPAQPSPPVSSDLSEQRPAPKQEVTSSPIPQLARPATTTKIAAPRKHTETATSAAVSLAQGNETERDGTTRQEML